MVMIVQRPRRRKRRVPWRSLVLVLVIAGAAGGAWKFFGGPRDTPPDEQDLTAQEEALPSDVAEETALANTPVPAANENEQPAPEPRIILPPERKEMPPKTVSDPEPLEDPSERRASNDVETGNSQVEAARKLYESGQVVAARQRLNTLLHRRLPPVEEDAVRALLTKIADETVFGMRNVPNDPCVASYTISGGDRLVKIAPQYSVPHEIIMTINKIADERRIRVGQRLKIPRGPFHVKISKSRFRMDVYLKDVYVRSYRVGLGSENGTPEGVWRVKNRLQNPTYYPPASATNKRIIAADDPKNPLGEHWIGLEGVEGNAVGREGFGIHGTIEPESIGKAVSMGCVRMRNEDVAVVYSLLTEGKSTVTIEP
jgi:LysM repeat protein